jgi:GMP synthase (glutamine-hydrolysing)
VENDPVLAELPSSFNVNASHVDSVVRLPEAARVLGTTKLEPVSAFAVGDTTWCVQFHPEFDGDVVRGYVRARSTPMKNEGLDPERAIASAADAPEAREVLRRFVRRLGS